MIREIRRLSEYLLHYGMRDEYFPGQMMHFCPACKEVHPFAIDKPFHNGAQWKFSGPYEKPTFHPSMLIRTGPDGRSETHICHYFLRDGVIEYLNDCTHSLRGKKVPLPKIPEKYLSQWRAFGLNRPI